MFFAIRAETVVASDRGGDRAGPLEFSARIAKNTCRSCLETLKAKLPGGEWKSYGQDKVSLVPPHVKFEVEATRGRGLFVPLQAIAGRRSQTITPNVVREPMSFARSDIL